MFAIARPLAAGRFLILTAVVAMGAVTASLPSRAETAEEKGRAIAAETDRRDLGWGTQTTAVQMILRNAHGETSIRELSIRSAETHEPGLGDRSLIGFSSPRDVAGTTLLSHTKITEADDQWLYLPALKRVKRISSSNKSGPFLGSEFAFEDLTSQELDKYDYKWLRDESLDGVPCFVVERYPRYESSGYTRQVVWTDTTEYRPLRIEYYDRKNALLKTLALSDYKRYQDQYWRPLSMTMTNHQSGKSTVLRFDEYEFGLDIDESTFTASRLRLAR